ncbi:MAG: N-acetylmuramoyl-L-alanine amidase [Alphaproteobacteria bacterium]|nr:N-acetylmuramoyl-L-alanine amidase [Alphaproteobacteria bacterium]
MVYKKNTTQILLTFTYPVKISDQDLLPPLGRKTYRLVLDFQKSTVNQFESWAKTTKSKIDSSKEEKVDIQPSIPAQIEKTASNINPSLSEKPVENSDKTIKSDQEVKTTPSEIEPKIVHEDFKDLIPPSKPSFKENKTVPIFSNQNSLPVKPNTPKPIVIVLDPGHGGNDPGAISEHNLREKNITLAMALQLKKLIEETGRYKVFLTRNSDRYVVLRDRIAIARQVKGDLFISLHADMHSQPNLRGASIYTLSEQASDAEAEALASKENKADLIAGVDLTEQSPIISNILIDLTQRETMNRSVQFATLLVEELKESTLLLHNTHRFAGFAVLKAPDIPSVLLEMGYLSNPEDEILLNSPEYHAKLAGVILSGVERYFALQKRVEIPD